MTSMASDPSIKPVILSGGGGTRLWPLSRPEHPKQFLKLLSEQTLLQVTAARVDDPSLYASPTVVANSAHAEEIALQLLALGIALEAVIMEPVGRGTAPAVALAALNAAPQDVLLVMPSDHVILDPKAFHTAVRAGLAFAKQGWLITFGIAPTYPETGYGYIRKGAELGEQVSSVERFVEKPERATAESMLADGRYLWNSGIFLFRAERLLEELEHHAPAVLSAARGAMDRARREDVRIATDTEAFLASPSASIDCAVMEKVERVAVVPVDCGWSDIGSWDALYQLGPLDGAGNMVSGAARLVDTSGCLVRTEGVRVSALGVSDLIIVATRDEVLILPRGKSQDLRRFSSD
jgi:mannose-1-phosphate guanylyltransferase/mannose-1-phosphate guanylyltransferase/mannose-6-phosphate isomerase